MTRMLLLAVCLTVAACGVKGPLKKPSQMRIDEQKKQQQLEKKQRKLQQRPQESGMAPTD